ncbi:MAG: VanZ family protein [Ruminococcus sp.]|nr:VanZ family protein [Ruminococcus sp.]
MKENSTSLKFRIIVFVLTFSVIAFAFIHSSMPSEVSGDESESVMNVLQSILNFFGFKGELTDHLVRKLAHFTEYTAMGMLFVSCAYSFDRIRPYKYYSQILLSGLATAVCDETIQLNVPGRAGMVTDVLLDFSGVITGALIMLLVFRIYKRIRKIT